MEHVLNSEAVNDRELVARLQGGDEKAFDDLVRRHQQRALNVAFQLLRNHEDAMEVAQDAFVKVYRSIGEFRSECEFTTWLHQIVVNLARNRYRWWQRRARHATVSIDEAVGPVAAHGDGPDVEAANAEFVQALSEKMAELPAKFREVLVLRNVENMRYEEIAIALECSVGTVKSRIARAREALREAMAGEW
jgi:RNA polymerase sigma-70 factor (ECF subfamily)